jgi:hypothetical protein
VTIIASQVDFHRLHYIPCFILFIIDDVCHEIFHRSSFLGIGYGFRTHNDKHSFCVTSTNQFHSIHAQSYFGFANVVSYHRKIENGAEYVFLPDCEEAQAPSSDIIHI